MSQEQSKIPSSPLRRLREARQGSEASQTQSKTFGKYILQKKLGQGGMGAVYLASDPTLQRQVALKVMTVEGKELTERFNREAQAMAKLKHPNIIQVYEVGTIPTKGSGLRSDSVGKYHYFTMEYIQGPSLDALINPAHQRVGVGVKDKTNRVQPLRAGADQPLHARAGCDRLSHRHIAEIIRDTASALDYAHKQGIIHRDIKPANIIIDSNNRPYLMDFGLAKELTGLDRSLTMSGSIMGTPDYMSPEQAIGDKNRIDHRSDIFSLGATFYHCITGRLPFEGKELYQVLNHVINKDPISPSRLIRGLPKDLETICLKCMNKEKESRYQTSKILAEDINRYLQGESISARPTGMVTKIIKKAKKNKLASISIIGAAVIMIAVIIGLSVSSVNKKQKIEEFSKQANAEFKEERYEETVALCTKLLVLSPEDEEIKTLLRKSQSVIKEKEDKMQAEKEAEKAKAAKMQNERDKRNKAKAVLDRANGAPTPEQKIKIARESLEADPTFGDAYQVIGYAYKEKKDYDKAYEYFTKAIENTPTLAYSYCERGYITAVQRGDQKSAIPDFEKVLEYDPNSHIGFLAKGFINYFQYRFTEAIIYYTKAIDLYPNYMEAYATRGVIYVALGDFEKALADCDKAIEIDPKSAGAYTNRGIVYVSKGDFDKAFADCNKAIETDPKSTGAYLSRGLAYASKGDFDKAFADYNKAIEINSNYAIAYTTRGMIYATLGEFDKALADYNKAIEINPDDAVTYAARGTIYSSIGKIDNALTDYTTAIEIAPHLADPYTCRAFIYTSKNEFEKALADCNKAILINPKSAKAYNGRGFVYYCTGEIDKAISNYDKALQLEPKLVEAYANRGVAYGEEAGHESNRESSRELYRKAIADGEMALKLAPNHSVAKQIRDLIEQWKKALQNK